MWTLIGEDELSLNFSSTHTFFPLDTLSVQFPSDCSERLSSLFPAEEFLLHLTVVIS